MIKETIRRAALEIGFDACRFTTAAPVASYPKFVSWLAEGMHGAMTYLERQPDRRGDPQLVLAGARSIIVLASNYGIVDPPNPSAPAAAGWIARYARYRDYHLVLGEKLSRLASLITRCLGPGIGLLPCVDTGPVLERDIAQRAGLGFIGCHSNLICRHLGNWTVLSEILTTALFEPDPPEANRCGKCRRCLEACPTRAITAPFRLDARRCLSYWTIENKGSIPVEFRKVMGRRVFGCDDCLAICPWNRFARYSHALVPYARPGLAAPDLRQLLELDIEGFRAWFNGTPLERLKRDRLLRNACVAAGNTGNSELIPQLEILWQRESPLVKEHAAWAIGQLAGH